MYSDESRTTRLHELQFAIPGLVVNTIGMFGVGMSMRGISDQSIAGLSVAPHMNGVYLGDANAAIARLFDIERIEVLKGPQGLLCGRNSTGGSINVITRAPQNSPDSEIEVAFGSFETTRAQGYLNLPLSNSAMRFAFIASEGDGYIRNSVDDRRFGQDDYWGSGFLSDRRRRCPARGRSWRSTSVTTEATAISGRRAPHSWLDPHDIRLTTVHARESYLISEIDNLNVNLEYELGFATLRFHHRLCAQRGCGMSTTAQGSRCWNGCVRSALPNDFEQWSRNSSWFSPLRFSGRHRGRVLRRCRYCSELVPTFPLVSAQPLSDSHSTSSNPALSRSSARRPFTSPTGWSATAGCA